MCPQPAMTLSCLTSTFKMQRSCSRQYILFTVIKEYLMFYVNSLPADDSHKISSLISLLKLATKFENGLRCYLGVDEIKESMICV